MVMARSPALFSPISAAGGQLPSSKPSALQRTSAAPRCSCSAAHRTRSAAYAAACQQRPGIQWQVSAGRDHAWSWRWFDSRRAHAQWWIAAASRFRPPRMPRWPAAAVHISTGWCSRQLQDRCLRKSRHRQTALLLEGLLPCAGNRTAEVAAIVWRIVSLHGRRELVCGMTARHTTYCRKKIGGGVRPSR
jgi:hypothetical protein